MLREEGAEKLKEAKRRKGSKRTVHILCVNTTDEASVIVNKLSEIGKRFTEIEQDGDSLFNTMLSCVQVPEGFNCFMFRKQISFRNP